jgi:hypothetical protein
MVNYFRARDELDPASRQELLDRLFDNAPGSLFLLFAKFHLGKQVRISSDPEWIIRYQNLAIEPASSRFS